MVRSVLADLSSGRELDTTIERLANVHPKNNTFPAEELLELAADAIEEPGATPFHPIDYERIRENYLPERVFKGKVEHHRSHYALSAAAMIRGGVYPDLLGEVGWWHNDDLWFYAFFALVMAVGSPSRNWQNGHTHAITVGDSKNGYRAAVDLLRRRHAPD